MHRLKPGVKISGTYYRDVLLRQMLHPNIRATSGSEFFVFRGQCPITSRQRHSSAAGSRDARFYPTRSGRLTHRTSTRLSTPRGMCFRSESIVPRYRTSTNWNDALTASGPLWVTRLLDVLLASGVNVYVLAFVLEPGGRYFEHTL